MLRFSSVMGVLSWMVLMVAAVQAQPYGEPDLGSPGDQMIQAALAAQSDAVHAKFADDLQSLASWQQRHAQYREEYLYMLGLWPLPEKTPLHPTVTGTMVEDGFVVEMIHYQSRPGLYVTGNLYRPAKSDREKHPAVLYVCGHSSRGRNGNKTAYQSHGIWFARHGYVCLLLDTLQLGEIGATHHGTYREGRWWWHSRGYTPAGVECWNGIRGIDYLMSRPDVDPERIAVTGISGGGAATFWIAAADERVRAAAPVSGMADLLSYVPNRVINGHCDCMFLYNTFQWPWTRIAAMIAPRPLLFVNSDQDPIFPMDANERVINRLERLYSLYGASDQVDAVVSVGGHAYREDLRQAVYRFVNLHLNNDPAEVTDSEVDLVTDSTQGDGHPIDPMRLRVFATDRDLPQDQLNTTIDQHFVPVARVDLPGKGEFDDWRSRLQNELRRVCFRGFPEPIPAARVIEESNDLIVLETEPGIRVRLFLPQSEPPSLETEESIPLSVVSSEEAAQPPARESHAYRCEVRGLGATAWTTKNPPNYVSRSHVLLGRTVDAGRIWDLVATARYVQQRTRDALADRTPCCRSGPERCGRLGRLCGVAGAGDCRRGTDRNPDDTSIRHGATAVECVARLRPS